MVDGESYHSLFRYPVSGLGPLTHSDQTHVAGELVRPPHAVDAPVQLPRPVLLHTDLSAGARGRRLSPAPAGCR